MGMKIEGAGLRGNGACVWCSVACKCEFWLKLQQCNLLHIICDGKSTVESSV